MTNSNRKTEHFDAGQIILKKGDEATKAYMIVSGKVRVFLEEDTKQVELATLGEDDIFGETAIFTDQVYGANIEAIEKAELFVITRESFNEMLKGADPVMRALIRMLIERLKNTNQALLKSETREFMDIAFI